MDGADETLQRLARTAAQAIIARWQFLATMLTITGALTGINYFHGYFGYLGLESLVLSLPLTTYLFAGGVSIVFLLLVTGLLACLAMLAAVPLGRVMRKDPFAATQAGRPLFRSPVELILVVFATTCVAVACLWASWGWVVSARPLLPFDPPAVLTLTLVLALVVCFGASLAFLLVHLHGRAHAAFLVAFLLLASPALAASAGEAQAKALLNDLDGHARARVWWHANDTGPEGYVVIYQQGDTFYLLQQTTQKPNGARVFHTMVVEASQVYRIVLVPPRANATEALVNAT